MRAQRARASPQAIGFLVSLLALLALPGLTWAGDPGLRWRTLETEHFRIHYYQGEEVMARALAARAERAHALVAPLLGHSPKSVTHVVLSDDVDSANGSATVIPYNLIHLFATGPESESILNDFDDWANVLITHEYSHILHMDNVSGLPVLINATLGLGMGKIYAPNQVQPRWFIEGLATYEESARTSGGRTRSRIFDMWLRMAVLEGRFQSLDKVSSGTHDFPHGTTAYLYGAFFIKYIADRFGQDVLAKVSKSYGGSLIPFGLNRAILEATGHDYETLWAEFYATLRHRYETQRDEIEARGRTDERVLTHHFEGTVYPYPWPGADDGGDDILYLRQDGYDRASLMLVPADGSRAPRVLYKMESLQGGKGVPLPDGHTVITSENDVCRTYYYYNDLFMIDLATGRRRRLTTCARALDPDVSPNGRQVAYSSNEPGGKGTALRVMDLEEDAVPRTLVSGEGGRVRAYTPTWSPDGATIAYSQWNEGGYRDIVLLDVASGRSRRLLRDRAIDVTPRYSPDGKYVLFSSDRSGVYNVYAYELASGKLWQVTNVLGGAFQPAVAKDGHTVVYQGFSADGYDIHSAPYEPASWKEALPYVSDREDAPPWLEGEAQGVVQKDRPYSPWSTVHPWRIAAVDIAPGSFEQQLLLDLSGSDAVGIHAWTFHLEQGLSGRAETNLGLSYGWDRLWAPLQFNFFHRTVRSGGFQIDNRDSPYAEEQWNTDATAYLPIVSHNDYKVTLNVGYHYDHFGSADPLMIPLDPNQAIPVIPEHGALAGLTGGFQFSNARRYLYSVTNEAGRVIAFNLTVDDEALGGTFHQVNARWGWTEFLQMPFRRHSLMLEYAGAIGEANLRRRGLFYLGGFGDNVPYSRILLCALRVKSADLCSAGTPSLRGYPPGGIYGDQYHVFTTEYRFPIADLERGVSTLPVYAERLVGAAYADYGLAYSGSTHLSNFRLGVGGEIGLNVQLGYTEGVSFRLGFARGLMSDGENQLYFQFRLGELY